MNIKCKNHIKLIVKYNNKSTLRPNCFAIYKGKKCFPMLHIAAWEKKYILWPVYTCFPHWETIGKLDLEEPD